MANRFHCGGDGDDNEDGNRPTQSHLYILDDNGYKPEPESVTQAACFPAETMRSLSIYGHVFCDKSDPRS